MARLPYRWLWIVGLVLLPCLALPHGRAWGVAGVVLIHLGAFGHWRQQRRLAQESVALARSTARQLEETVAGKAQDLDEAESRYRTLFESSRDALLTLAPSDWRFTAGNPAAVALFGTRDEAELLAAAPWQLSPERQPDGELSSQKGLTLIETALRDGSHYFEWTHRRLSGEEFSTLVLLTRTEIQGQVLLQASVRDNTAQKQAEAVLRADHDRTQALLHLTQLGGESAQSILAKGLDYALDFSASPLGFVALLNEDESVLSLQHWSADVIPGGIPRTPPVSLEVARLGRLAEAIRQREPFWTNEPVITTEPDPRMPHGHAAIHRYLSVPVFDGGRIVALLSVANKPSDYTTEDVRNLEPWMDGVWRHACRLRAEEALWENQSRLRTLFEKSLDAHLLWQKGVVKDCNAAALALLGRSRGEVVGQPLVALSPDVQPDGVASQQKVALYLDEALHHGTAQVPWVYRRGGGGAFWSEQTLTAVTVQGEPCLFIAFRDITSQKRLEAALLASEQQCRSLAQQLQASQQQPLRPAATSVPTESWLPTLPAAEHVGGRECGSEVP